MSLQTVLYECNSIHFDRPFDSFLHLYSNAKATAGQGSSDTKTFLTYKDKQGKTKTCSNFYEETFTEVFERQYEIQKVFKLVSGDNIIPFSKNANINNVEKLDISDRIYSKLSYDMKYDPKKVYQTFEEHSLEYISSFSYTHKFSIPIASVKMEKNSITFAHTVTTTYNSLPEIITIKKIPELKTIKLESLKIEDPGYYHHRSDQLEIREEDKKEALDFLKEFKSIK